MGLVDKQNIFLRKISVLIQIAQEMGYQVTCGDFYRDPRCDYGHGKSLHKSRLAADLNLFMNGEYLTDGSGHDELHDVWDKIGGAPRIENDSNHYSLEYKGMR